MNSQQASTEDLMVKNQEIYSSIPVSLSSIERPKKSPSAASPGILMSPARMASMRVMKAHESPLRLVPKSDRGAKPAALKTSLTQAVTRHNSKHPVWPGKQSPIQVMPGKQSPSQVMPGVKKSPTSQQRLFVPKNKKVWQ